MAGPNKTAVVVVALLAVVLVLGASAAYATESRVAAMGGAGHYLHDNSNVYYYPGTMLGYGGEAVAELRAKQDDQQYTVGVNLPYNDWVFGVYLNREPFDLELPANPFGIGYFPGVQLGHATDLYFAKPLGGFNAGLRISWAFDADIQNLDIEADEVTQAATYLSGGFGLSNDQFDFAGDLELPAASYESSAGKYTWGGVGLGLNARAFFDFNEDFVLTPVAVLRIRSTSTDMGDLGQDTDYGSTRFGFGAALSHKVNDDNNVMLAFEFLGLSSDVEDIQDGTKTTNSTFTFPAIYLGFESAIKPWLTGRFGAAQAFQVKSRKIEPNEGDSDEDGYSVAEFDATFGLGFHFGRFTLDCVFNEGLLFDGPNFLSGKENEVGNRLSVTYDFN